MSEIDKTWEVKATRAYSAHHLFIQTANIALKNAKESEDGRWLNLLTSMTFSALSLEAISNTYGHALVKDWSDFDKSSPKAKLRVVCSAMKIPEIEIDWSQIGELHKFRNRIAHVKPDYLRETHECSEEEYERKMREWPKSKVEKMLTINHAENFFNIIKKLEVTLRSHIPNSLLFGLGHDGASFSGSLLKKKT